MNTLVVIDGNAMMHRAYHALPPLTTPDGKPSHVVYGFASVLIKLFTRLEPTHMTVAFDRPGPTFRDELFEAYQKQRPKMEDDFISQIPLVHTLVEAFHIPVFEKDGYEADDMIGTISAQAYKKGIDRTIIVTGDRDILQLVIDERVMVFMPTKGLSEGIVYGEKEVVGRMGVLPKQIIDLKALMGDSSDNYPGVSGIGPKTAITLLTTYGTLEAIYKAVDADSADIKSSVKDKLRNGKESALLGKELATIKQDAPITFHAKDARVETLDSQSARDVLTSFHFPSLITRLQKQDVLMPEKKEKKKQSTPSNQKSDEQQSLF